MSCSKTVASSPPKPSSYKQVCVSQSQKTSTEEEEEYLFLCGGVLMKSGLDMFYIQKKTP